MPEYRLVTARKQHTCMLCFRPIPAGSQYRYERLGPHVSSDHDDWWTYRAHPTCHDVFMAVLDELPEPELPDGPDEWQEILELHADLPRIRAERAERERRYRELQEQLRQERERRQMAYASRWEVGSSGPAADRRAGASACHGGRFDWI